MVLSCGVEGHLLVERTLQVIAESSAVIQDANECVHQVHLRHLAMGKLVVHQVLALTLKALADFRVYQGQQFPLVALDRLLGLRVLPPLLVCLMDL